MLRRGKNGLINPAKIMAAQQRATCILGTTKANPEFLTSERSSTAFLFHSAHSHSFLNRTSISTMTSHEPNADLPAKGEQDSVVLPVEDLKPGYKKLHERLHTLMTEAAIISLLSPTLSGIWLYFTEQMLYDSPVAMAALAVGVGVVAKRMVEVKRTNNYTHYSAILNADGPSFLQEANLRIKKIMAGENPSTKLTMKGLKVSGTVGDLDHPSTARQETLAHILGFNRIVIPACTLTPRAEKLAELAHERWLARTTVPFSVLNIIGIMSKKSEDRHADDAIVLAAAFHNIYDFFSGTSVEEARAKFTDSFMQCRTPQEVLKVLIDNNILDEGGMSFLNEWIKNQKTIGVRVGRTGTPVIYGDQGRQFSLGGPYPITVFPRKTQPALPLIEETKEMSLTSRK